MRKGVYYVMLKRLLTTTTLVVTLGAALLSGAGFQPATAHAASNMVPDYDINLLMNPSVVLGSDFKLTSAVLTTFSMPTTVTKMHVAFLDTNTKSIYSNGWSPRIRKMEGESEFV